MNSSHDDLRGDVKALLRRQYEIQDAMRRPGGIRITVERELLAIREQLQRHSPASRSSVCTPEAP